VIGTGAAGAEGAEGAAGAAGAGGATRPAADGVTGRVAFVKSVQNTTVWIAAADGTGARQLGVADAPVLSPDGTLVAAQNFGPKGPSLIVFKVAGGRLTMSAAIAKQSVSPLAWSPDSRYLAAAVQSTGQGFGPGSAALDVIDVTTGKITASAPGVISGASFEPGTSDQVVFGLARSLRYTAPTNLYSMPADGSAPPTQLTHDGRSTNPVWGPSGIIFDSVTPRGKNAAPLYQIVVLSGGKRTQITHMKVPQLEDGLMPIAVSADGTKLVAEYVGEDTSQGYTVDLATHKVVALTVPKQENSAYGISSDGTRVLVTYGGFEGPSTHAVIATMPFGGGKPTVLIHGGYQPSWNQ
jgi:Tol biopolymer transport system component